MSADLFDRMNVLRGDITTQQVDAIVNAANESLLGGGGVDGAIHRAAGPELLEECRRIGGCPVGEARITRGYRLPARWVIHTAGPIWRGGLHGEPELLRRCYQSCFDLADQHGLHSLAFPSISTGAYGYPVELAARIAVTETMGELRGGVSIEKVTFVCFDDRTYDEYCRILADLQEASQILDGEARNGNST